MIPRYLVNFDLNELPVLDTDVIVIGSGIAGLYTAIRAAEEHQVTMITKRSLLESNTRYAQGGIAAVFSEEDSPQSHLEDTLLAGAGLCSSQAVDILVQEGPDRVRELMKLGTAFDLENGEIALTKEGAHSHRRILHANGDATGYEIVRALSEQVIHSPNVELWEDHYVIDLITEGEECLGALVQQPDGQRVFFAGEKGNHSLQRRRRTALSLHDESGGRYGGRHRNGLSGRGRDPGYGIYPIPSDLAMLSWRSAVPDLGGGARRRSGAPQYSWRALHGALSRAAGAGASRYCRPGHRSGDGINQVERSVPGYFA